MSAVGAEPTGEGVCSSSDYVVLFPGTLLPDVPAPYCTPPLAEGACLSPRSLQAFLPSILRSAMEYEVGRSYFGGGGGGGWMMESGMLGELSGGGVEETMRHPQVGGGGRVVSRGRRRRCGDSGGIAGTGGRVMSGSITYDKSQNRFMTQWKSSDGTKHSKSFYVKNFGSTEAARERAEEFRRVLLGGGTEEMLKECAGVSCKKRGRRAGGVKEQLVKNEAVN
eukprot:GHVS01005370.1.p1 GENE.GHVS01005370.1~~GHVS01005370.1.p1  ORF type:complete len:237 (-),score=82.31 GHVS01005370.1:82-750(-)